MGDKRPILYLHVEKEVITIKKKNRKQKALQYLDKYNGIPLDDEERLGWLVDKYNLTDAKMQEILAKRTNMMQNLFFYECQIVQLLEIPEGSQRPRFRIINKKNFNRAAIGSQFVHVYTPNAAEDHTYMKKLCDNELVELDYLINTPCIVEYDAFYPMPANYNISDIFLAEIGLIRPAIMKPDWDNLGKKYCDMYNHNIWIDDSLVYDGSVHKYYSVLPRVEIKLRYLNTVYNKSQYKQIIDRKDYDGGPISYLDRYGRIAKNEQL